MNKLLLTLLLLSDISVCFSQRVIETIAGNGVPNFEGREEVPAVTSPVSPFDVAVDKAGNIYFTEASYSYTVRKIDHITGNITTVAGNGTQGFSGDGGLAILAQFNEPRGIAIDDSGNLFVADYWNNRIRRIDAVTGIVTTVAGNGAQDFAGDGGLAVAASIFNPNDVAIDDSGNLYIADLNNFCIRKVLNATGIISTIAGRGKEFGYNGDGSLATSALLATPSSVAVDNEHNVYIADWFNNRIRKLTVSSGLISTIAGTGELGNAGDGSPAINAELYGPRSVEVDAHGNVYISEAVNLFVNAKIRKIDKETGIIYSIAGNGINGYSGDGGPANEAKISGPVHLVFDERDNIYIADLYNFRIRKITTHPFSDPEIVYSDSCLANGMAFHIEADFAVFNVKWDFGDPESSTPNTSQELAPIHKFARADTYSVKAIVDSDFGRDSLEVEVYIEDCNCQIEIPNVFTPNGDGYNDEYYTIADCPLEVYRLSIINRWGREVFRSNTSKSRWNGKESGKECSAGVYFCILSYKFSGLPLREYKGSLSLFR